MAEGYWDIQINFQVNSVADDEILKLIESDGDPATLDKQLDLFVEELIPNRAYLRSRIQEALGIGHFAYTHDKSGPGKEVCWVYNPVSAPHWRIHRGCTCSHCLKFD